MGEQKSAQTHWKMTGQVEQFDTCLPQRQEKLEIGKLPNNCAGGTVSLSAPGFSRHRTLLYAPEFA